MIKILTWQLEFYLTLGVLGGGDAGGGARRTQTLRSLTESKKMSSLEKPAYMDCKLFYKNTSPEQN